MASCVREYDVVGRLGGDEFTIILGELDDVNRVEKIAENLLEKLSAPYQLGVETVYLSASIGITLYPEDGGDVPTLLKNADQAMYSAKGDGRNRFHYFTPSMQDAIQNRMQLSNDLRTALTKQQFEIHYQPIIELATHSIVKAEALIRWQNPNRGLVSPADFIPISEETGLIVEIGDWVFRQAAAQVAQWRARHQTEFQISINMSPVQFRSNFDNHAEWIKLLKELNLSGQSIAIEITEGLLVEASDAVTSQLLSFRDNGIQVAIDDFGTGYSSLAYLKKFDIDFLKIDRSFVSNLGNNADDVVLCAAIIGMAHKLGIKVIAEGVETKQQSDLLKEMGCDYGQGYLFSKAVPAAEFEAILARSGETEGQKWYA
jgi:EAL domain-containing protein (putative c-di-GMP-specific phosphodiesterase class I)